jgi:hypothetical protein
MPPLPKNVPLPNPAGVAGPGMHGGLGEGPLHSRENSLSEHMGESHQVGGILCK